LGPPSPRKNSSIIVPAAPPTQVNCVLNCGFFPSSLSPLSPQSYELRPPETDPAFSFVSWSLTPGSVQEAVLIFPTRFFSHTCAPSEVIRPKTDNTQLFSFSTDWSQKTGAICTAFQSPFQGRTSLSFSFLPYRESFLIIFFRDRCCFWSY